MLGLRLYRFLPYAVAQRLYLVETAKQIARYDGLGCLARNRALRQQYAGRRCFVIAHGPSLRSMDLSPLAKEHVLTVNSFHDYQEYRDIVPVCHTMIDPFFFTKEHYLPSLRGISAARFPGTKLFFPLQYRPIVERELDAQKGLDIHYLVQGGNVETNSNIDLSGVVPGLQTVPIAALMIALHLGFSRVYLIGCDLDFLNDVVGVQPLRVRYRRFEKEEEQDWSKEGFDYTLACDAVVKMFKGFALMRDQAAPEQQIFNAGKGGWLDLFPRVEFKSLF